LPKRLGASNQADKVYNGEGSIQAGAGDKEGVMGRGILDGRVLLCDSEWERR